MTTTMTAELKTISDPTRTADFSRCNRASWLMLSTHSPDRNEKPKSNTSYLKTVCEMEKLANGGINDAEAKLGLAGAGVVSEPHP